MLCANFTKGILHNACSGKKDISLYTASLDMTMVAS